VFAESIGNLISFIEANPLVKAGGLAAKMLGIEAPADGASLTQEQREKIVRMQGDLIWLVREGYVTEFIDGGLYAPPAMVEARKKEVEIDEVDPENFPEAPAAPAASVPEAPVQAAPDPPPAASAPEAPVQAAPDPPPAADVVSEAPPPAETPVA